MKQIRSRLVVALLLGTFLLLDYPAQAASRSHYSARNYRSNYRTGRSGYSAASKAYADLARANAIRAAAIRAAQAEVSRAYSALRTTRTKIARDFEYAPEMNAATAALTKARRELDAARQAARERLSRDLNYQAAKASNDTATIGRMQSAADRADADVRASLGRVQEVADKIKSLKRDFEGSVTSNPQWLAAQQKLEGARIQRAQSQAAANRYLNSANQARSRANYPRR